MVALWNGTAWRYIAATTPTNGTVLQIVSTTKNDVFTTGSTSFVDLTGLNATITPKSSTSKVLVTVSISANMSSANIASFNLVRGSTNIAQPSGGTSPATIHMITQTAQTNETIMFLDSPSTTSSTTYKIQAKVFGGTLNVNRSAADNNYTSVSTITLMEIAG
jgi:hypothetical protein